jgi:hypothetical protein
VQANRPTVVTILGVLAIISGILMLVSGAVIGFGAAIILSSLSPGSEFREYGEEQLGPQAQSIGVPLELLGPLAMIEAAFLIVLGFVSLRVAFGLFKGKRWAWKATLVLSLIWIGAAIFTSLTGGTAAGVVPVILISGVILYFLFRPNVKEYFGRTENRPTSEPAQS